MISLGPRFHEERREAAAYCANFRWRNISLNWKAQKRCIRERLGAKRGEKNDRLKDTTLQSTGRRPTMPKVWRSMHAAINFAYAARHGHDVYFADVQGCKRAPSWCVKLSVHALLFDDGEKPPLPTYDWVMVLDEDAFFSDMDMSLAAYLEHASHGTGADLSFAKIRASRSSADRHHATTKDKCIVIGKDVEPYAGCNAGVVFYHRTELMRELLSKWWSVALHLPLYAQQFFIDQGAFNGEWWCLSC